MSKVADASLRRSAEGSITAITDAARDGRADRVASLAVSRREVFPCLPKKTRESLFLPATMITIVDGYPVSRIDDVMPSRVAEPSGLTA